MTTPSAESSPVARQAYRALDRAQTASSRRRSGPRTVAAVLALVGLTLTGLAAWVAAELDQRNEHRLLVEQTQQAASLVTTAIAAIEAPLQTALDVAVATDASASTFLSYIRSQVGPHGPFVAASLWQRDDGHEVRRALVGTPIGTPATQLALITSALATRTVAVAGVPSQHASRIAYSLGDPSTGDTVYAERAIPANRRVSVESESGFADLDFATYLGPRARTAELTTTDLPTDRLPLTGHTARAEIPFGDTDITLVTRARGHLGGTAQANLWWLVVVAGCGLTVAGAAGGARLARLRRLAETDAGTVAELYHRLDELYEDQHSISLTLQKALLPQSNPPIPGLDVGSRYVAGASGVDVGGDWYSVIRVDETRFGFVVGDVSGRGVRAAAVMARMRFTIRAYLAEGHPPDQVLALASRQLDVVADGHLATALVGTASIGGDDVLIASAGHPSPLLVRGGKASFVDLVPGRPLGARGSNYPTTRVAVSTESMLIAYTDGLVERRDEDLDVGLERLRAMAERVTQLHASDAPPDLTITSLLEGMTAGSAGDDIAVLALRWRPVPEA